TVPARAVRELVAREEDGVRSINAWRPHTATKGLAADEVLEDVMGVPPVPPDEPGAMELNLLREMIEEDTADLREIEAQLEKVEQLEVAHSSRMDLLQYAMDRLRRRRSAGERSQ